MERLRLEWSVVDGLLVAGQLVAAVLLLALPRLRWLRLHDAPSPLSWARVALRVAPIALATAAFAATASALPGRLSAELAPPESWAWLLRGETVVAVGLLLVLCLLDDAIGRSWLLLGSGLSAAAAWGGARWLEGLEAPSAIGETGTALLAALLTALLLSPGPTSRLVARVMRDVIAADGLKVLLLDPAGRIRHAGRAARLVLGLDPRPFSLLRSRRDPLPRALQVLLERPAGERVKLRTPAGRILEARRVELERRGPAREVRAILVRDMTSEHSSERRLLRLAHYDSLTGLANRRLFLETMKRTIESPQTGRAALFYIDLDDFKAINDSLGHTAGDALLRALADRFRSHLSPEETRRLRFDNEARPMVARLAGDEFAVIAPGIADGEAAGEFARYMIDFLRRPLELGSRTLRPSASIGIALFPDHGSEVEALLRHADSALYVAKSRGRQRFAWYEPSFEAKLNRAGLIEEGLRRALERGELRLHYQPKLDAHSGVLVGFEALLRWNSYELGDVGPAEFIPIAEQRGIITELGSWCIDEACRQLREWREKGLAIVPVSVNVSSVQFAESDLQREVGEALKRHGVDPRQLELELTESLLLDERSHVEQILRDVRTIGVRIALDDFGTGYSALGYLNRFSLDVLKMDRSLLRDIDGSPAALGIASAVVAMAHSLGLSVVAEGVDSEEQLPVLRKMDCDHIQGFLFAPALPAGEASRFLGRAGRPPMAFEPGMSAPGRRSSAGASAAAADDQPVLKSGPTSLAGPIAGEHAGHDPGRVLLVDDGRQTLGTVAMRLGHLGVDSHYAPAVDEAQLFLAQEREAIRLIVFSPSVDLVQLIGLRDALTELIGERRPLIVIGERPDEDARLEMRELGVDWALWTPFNDAELRYVVKSAMTLREDLVDRREVRVPVDLIANVWSGHRREVAVVSSISARGAFIELSEPFAKGSSMRIEMDLGRDRFRGFARTLHVQPEDPDRPEVPSGVGVAFYGVDRDQERLLRKTVSELQGRYLP